MAHMAPGSCCLWSRLAADGPAAAQQLCADDVADGAEVKAEAEAPEVLELLLEQLEVSADPSLHAWRFLTLQNLLCGSSNDALLRRQQLLQRGLLRHVATAAAEHSLASTQNTALRAQQTAERMRRPAEDSRGLHTLGSCCDPEDQDLLSEEVLSMLIRGLGTGWALEVREILGLEGHRATILQEILLELTLPDGSGADDASLSAPLRAMQLREAELLLEAMQALPFEARVQVTACTTLRRLALMAMAALAAPDTGRPSSAQCLALVQRLPRGMANTVQAMKQHEAGAWQNGWVTQC
eukprot:s17_g42.t1